MYRVPDSSKKKIHRGRMGSAIVEMAMVLPIFILLVVGIVEFGRVLMVQQVITNAAREGARAGSIYITDAEATSNATSVSQNYITASGVNINLVTVTPTLTTTGGLPALQVLVDYNYGSLLPSFIPGIPETLILRATAVMRREI